MVLAYSPLYIALDYVLLRWRGVAPKDINIHVEFGFHEVGSLVALVVYFGLLTYWRNGRTLGKRLLRIRAVSTDGSAPGFKWAAVRTLLLLFVIPACITDRDLRGLHDRAANTIVVRM